MQWNYRRLIKGKNRAVFQLFELISEAPKYELWTDNKSYIMMQSNENTPIWIWLDEKINDNIQTQYHIVDIMKERISKNPNVHFNAVPDSFSTVIPYLENEGNKKVATVMQMNVYVWKSSPIINKKGNMIPANDKYAVEMQKLLIQLVKDGEHEDMPVETAKQVVDSMITSQNVFLWKDEGEICSMAMIAHRGEHFTRINTVVTDRSKRGKGYAGMLASEMCRNEQQNENEIMLYADADNPASNRLYQRIGFEQVGQIAEYKMGKKFHT